MNLIRLTMIGAVFTVLAFPARATAQITVQVTKPLMHQEFTTPALPISVTVQSPLALSTVQAQLDAATLVLTFTSDTLYTGTMDLTGIATGFKTLTITATDIQGNTGTATIPVIYHLPPKITITSPLPDTVVHDVVHIAATCTNDDGTPCQNFVASYVYYSDATQQQVVLYNSDTGSFDELVDFSALNLGEGWMEFTSTSNIGLETAIWEPGVDIERTDKLIELAEAPLPIVDARCDRLLLQADWVNGIPGAFSVFDRATGQMTPVTPDSSLGPTVIGRLTASGVRFAASPTIPVVDGDYSLVFSKSTLHRINDTNGDDVIISSNVYGSNAAVSPVGDVAYFMQSSGLAFWQASTGTSMSIPGGGSVGPLVIDGTNVLGELGDGSIDVFNGLGTGTTVIASQADGYAMAGGWVAYTQKWMKADQVFLYSPVDGSTTQLTQFGSDATIEALDDAGGAMVVTSSQRYYVSPTAPPVLISTNNGHAFILGGAWHLMLGRFLFRIVTGIPGSDPAGPACPTAEQPTDAGILIGQLDMTQPPDMTSLGDMAIGSSAAGGGGSQSAGGSGTTSSMTGGGNSGCSAAPGSAPCSVWSLVLLVCAAASRRLRRRQAR